MKLSDLKLNRNNPRIIKDDKFKKLVKSIEEFPEMMSKRPIVCVTDVDCKIYPLGGNMRLKALQELKYKEVPDEWVQMADEWTEEQRREFVIKDNVGFGEWDWEQLANEWDAEKLEDWGLEVPIFNNDEYETTLGGESINITNDYIALITIQESKIVEAESLFKEIELLKDNGVIKVTIK